MIGALVQSGFICHKLNTAIKSAIDSEAIEGSRIMADLKSGKTILSTFNYTSMNNELEVAFKFIQ